MFSAQMAAIVWQVHVCVQAHRVAHTKYAQPFIKQSYFKKWFNKSYFTENVKKDWRREWQATPVFLPRSLAGYSPWSCKESDTTEQLTLSLSWQSYFNKMVKFFKRGTSLVIHWLKLRASIAEGSDSIPGWGTEILCATCHLKQLRKINKEN